MIAETDTREKERIEIIGSIINNWLDSNGRNRPARWYNDTFDRLYDYDYYTLKNLLHIAKMNK